MNDQPMPGKVALVAGASKGIGAVTAPIPRLAPATKATRPCMG